MTLDLPCIEELTWWSTQLRLWNGRDVHPWLPDMRIDTDASLTGWGAVCNGVCMGGLWSLEERRLHINHLELLAGSFAVQSFTKDRRNIHVYLRMDNKQQHCPLLCQQDEGDPFSQFNGTCPTPMAVMPPEGHNIISRVPARCEQSGGRQIVPISTDFSRVETGRGSFPDTMPDARPCQVGLFASRLNNQLD